MELHHALELYFKAVDSTFQLWTFYFTVALGTLGFVVTIAPSKLRLGAPIIIAAFIVFATFNLLIQNQAQHRRLAILRYLVANASDADSAVIAAFEPVSPIVVAFVHGGIDILVVAALVVLTRKRTRHVTK